MAALHASASNGVLATSTSWAGPVLRGTAAWSPSSVAPPPNQRCHHEREGDCGEGSEPLAETVDNERMPSSVVGLSTSEALGNWVAAASVVPVAESLVRLNCPGVSGSASPPDGPSAAAAASVPALLLAAATSAAHCSRRRSKRSSVRLIVM